MTDTTEPTEATGWDRRRFIKASAGGAALIWAAPTITGLDARAFAAGSCVKGDPVFSFVTASAIPPTAQDYVGPFVDGTNVLTVVQGNVDVVGPGTPFTPPTYPVVKSIDLTGGANVTTTRLVGPPLPSGDYIVEMDVYGSIGGGTGINEAYVSIGSSQAITTGSVPDDPSTLFSFSGTVQNVSGVLELRHESLADYRGLFLVRLEVFAANC